MSIAIATAADAADWAALRHALWPDTSMEEHATEIADMLGTPDDAITQIARAADGSAIGLVEASIRHDYVNGCDTSPVGFVEGIYVLPEHRRTGIATQLIEAVTDWVLGRGCTELASDAAIDNHQSHQMHNALGFEQTQRVVYFRKRLA